MIGRNGAPADVVMWSSFFWDVTQFMSTVVYRPCRTTCLSGFLGLIIREKSSQQRDPSFLGSGVGFCCYGEMESGQ